MTSLDRLRGRLAAVLMAAAVALAAAVAGVVVIGHSTGDPNGIQKRIAERTRPVTLQQLTARYGIRITLVGVTAAGGLVDLRFTVTDAGKAKKLFTDPSVMPAVMAEPDGALLQPPHGGRHAHITPVTGASYFMLMGNRGGAVQRGVPVTIVINGVRVEHVMAET